MNASDASTLAVGVTAVLSSLWGYYFIVIGGIATVIATISSAEKPIHGPTAAMLTVVIIAFSLFNWISINSANQTLNELIIAIHTDIKMHVPGISLWVHPLGPIVMIIWLWAYSLASTRSRTIAAPRVSSIP